MGYNITHNIKKVANIKKVKNNIKDKGNFSTGSLKKEKTDFQMNIFI